MNAEMLNSIWWDIDVWKDYKKVAAESHKKGDFKKWSSCMRVCKTCKTRALKTADALFFKLYGYRPNWR